MSPMAHRADPGRRDLEATAPVIRRPTLGGEPRPHPPEAVHPQVRSDHREPWRAFSPATEDMVVPRRLAAHRDGAGRSGGGRWHVRGVPSDGNPSRRCDRNRRLCRWLHAPCQPVLAGHLGVDRGGGGRLRPRMAAGPGLGHHGGRLRVGVLVPDSPVGRGDGRRPRGPGSPALATPRISRPPHARR